MALTEPKTAFAGVTLETSFARFMASMATLNEEIIPSLPFGRWDTVASMIQSQCSDEITAERAGCEEGPVNKDGRAFVVTYLVRTGPCDEEDHGLRRFE